MAESARNRVLVPFDFGQGQLNGDAVCITDIRVLLLRLQEVCEVLR